MEISAPLLGFMTDATLFERGATIDTTDWERGIVEFEVAVYLGRDLGPGASDDDARAAISAVGAAIELANVDLPIEAASVGEIVAGDIFHMGVMFGEPDQRRAGLDIEGLTARILIDGTERAETTDLQAITGAYPWIVRTVADTLAANSETLRAGDVIITGSVVPTHPGGRGHRLHLRSRPLRPDLRSGPLIVSRSFRGSGSSRLLERWASVSVQVVSGYQGFLRGTPNRLGTAHPASWGYTISPRRSHDH